MSFSPYSAASYRALRLSRLDLEVRVRCHNIPCVCEQPLVRAERKAEEIQGTGSGPDQHSTFLVEHAPVAGTKAVDNLELIGWKAERPDRAAEVCAYRRNGPKAMPLMKHKEPVILFEGDGIGRIFGRLLQLE